MAEQLDPIDVKILSLLQTNASLPIGEIAEAVGVSQSPCWRRIRRLEEAGVIERRVAVLNHEKLGLNFEAYLSVKLSRPDDTNLKRFEEHIKRMPEVVECSTVAGNSDYELHIVTTDKSAFSDFLRNELLAIELVQDVQSRIVMHTIKRSTSLPLKLIKTGAANS